jgi:acyl transferase domain-containing protein
MAPMLDPGCVQHDAPNENPSFEPIAIVGMAFKFPQGAESADAFWNMLAEKRCAATTFPKDRFDIDAFWHSDSKRQNIVDYQI